MQADSSTDSDQQKPHIAPESAAAVARAEEAATISVVKNAAPAVVSIRISKQVAINSRTQSRDPFEEFNDMFGYMFPQLMPNTAPAPKASDTAPEKQTQVVGGGSGFIVSPDGLIVTNKHVASDTDAIYTVITQDGKEYDAKVLARDAIVDVAVLQIEAQNLPTLSFGDSDNIRIGETVIAIGNALAELQNSVTKGIISGTNRRVEATGGGVYEVIEEAIQTDAAINPGNSGGPLIDLDGRVIGVNTAIDRSGQLIGFAIPANVVKRIVQSVEKHGRIVRPWIGVRYVLLDQRADMATALGVESGALILSSSKDQPAIVKGSPAEKAGLKERDVILKVNATEINIDHSLASVVSKFSPGDVINLTIRRDGKDMTVALTLAEFDEKAID
jgi:S1-C subfamily serine protease